MSHHKEVVVHWKTLIVDDLGRVIWISRPTHNAVDCETLYTMEALESDSLISAATNVSWCCAYLHLLDVLETVPKHCLQGLLLGTSSAPANNTHFKTTDGFATGKLGDGPSQASVVPLIDIGPSQDGLRRAIWVHILHLWSSTMLVSRDQWAMQLQTLEVLSSGKRSAFSSIVERIRWKVSYVTGDSLTTDLVQQWQSWFCKEQKMNMENTSPAKVSQATPVTKMPKQHHWTILREKRQRIAHTVILRALYVSYTSGGSTQSRTHRIHHIPAATHRSSVTTQPALLQLQQQLRSCRPAW